MLYIRTIFNSEGNKVGDISSGFWDNVAGKDRKTIRDAKGDKVGDISTSLADQFAGKDRKTIRDADGKKVGDITPNRFDKDKKLIDMKDKLGVLKNEKK
jgi:hypothetical protein